MSDIVNLSAGVNLSAVTPPSISEVLAPGIVGLFVQGLETGLVISQLSQWLYLERKEGIGITLLVVFVTTVGLSAFACFSSNQIPYLINLLYSVETAICFLSAWRIYVHNFGQAVSEYLAELRSRDCRRGLTRHRYCPRYYPHGPNPSTQCLYVSFSFLPDFAFSVRFPSFFPIVHCHSGTNSSIFHMALLPRQSFVDALHF
jgi:hypothetical protein